jgi:hypothetical protein
LLPLLPAAVVPPVVALASGPAAVLGPVLPNVSSAANWNIVPGQRRVRESPGLGYATDRVVKTNDLTWGNVLSGAWGHVRELRAGPQQLARELAVLGAGVRGHCAPGVVPGPGRACGAARDPCPHRTGRSRGRAAGPSCP